MPTSPVPALSPPFIRADDAARYAHERIGARRDREYGGFILQREDGLFVATEPVPGLHMAFDFSQVFDDYRDYPDGHVAEAVYHSHPRNVPTPWSGLDRRLYINFFSTSDMHAAIKDQGLSAVSYVSGPDGGLLRYTASGSAQEAALLERVSPPADQPAAKDRNPLQLQFAAGTLTPLAFIRQVAAAGDLRVVEPGDLWGTTGALTPAWSAPPAEAGSRTTDSVALGPVFTHLHDAVLYAQRRIHAASLPALASGVLLHNPNARLYTCTEPRASSDKPTLPAGYAVAGHYHATPAANGAGVVLARDFFDLDRLFECWSRRSDWPLYACTAEGALLEYRSRDREAERAFRDRWHDAEDLRDAVADGALTTVQVIRQVAALGSLSVVAASPIWRNQGPVDGQWHAFARPATLVGALGPQTCDLATASQRPAFGPPMASADDAARYAQRQSAARSDKPLIGFILKHLDEDSYLAAEPFVGIDSPDTQRLVLFSYANALKQGLDCARPRLPPRYRLHGLFLGNRPDPLRLAFFQPADLCFALGKISEGFTLQALYLATREGALLRYTPVGGAQERAICQRAPGASWWQRTLAIEEDLMAGRLRRATYVQRVAAVGELSVLETDAIWPVAGPQAKA